MSTTDNIKENVCDSQAEVRYLLSLAGNKTPVESQRCLVYIDGLVQERRNVFLALTHR